MIIYRPLPNIESALLDIERELDRLQGKIVDTSPDSVPHDPIGVAELSDALGELYKANPAYFTKKDIHPN